MSLLLFIKRKAKGGGITYIKVMWIDSTYQRYEVRHPTCNTRFFEFDLNSYYLLNVLNISALFDHVNIQNSKQLSYETSKRISETFFC